MKKALIFGVSGQDGSYLCEFLLEKGYVVYGVKRRSSLERSDRIDQIKNLIIHYGDVTDSTNVIRLISEIKPDEIYNLAAQSHVHVSFETPEYTANADALGTLRILEAIRILQLTNKTKFYQASTSELYGKTQEVLQSETTPFYPRSPYAAAKIYAYWITVNYREAYNIFACNGILFNHESPRRGETFVTRKISLAVAKIYHGIEEKLYLGNLYSKRDWGYAKEYVEAMWKMLQIDKADDFVIATGKTYTIKQFVDFAFSKVGIELDWTGFGVDEKGIDKKTGKILVEIDPRYFRPTEVDLLCGDATKANQTLGWTAKTSLEELVSIMLEHDLVAIKNSKMNFSNQYQIASSFLNKIRI